ncbi:MAG: hypothetical protein V7711_09185 [Pseudomonadales bacterium]
MSRSSLLLLSLLISSTSLAQNFTSRFIDEEDGWFDASNFLLEYKYGVMPVPIIITEPAVGEGFGVAAVYFHDADDAWEGRPLDDKGRINKRSTSAVAAAGTNNGTRLLGGGHFGHYKKDTIRYEGLGGVANINLKFYGEGSGQENPSGFKFNSEALFISQRVAFRLGATDWFAGAEYTYTDMTTKFDLGFDIPELDDLSFDSTNASVAALLLYDSLNNGYTPGSGINSELSFSRYDEKVGGDFNYNLLESRNQIYFEPVSQLNIGLRLDGQFADGDIPFYALPYIELRGIPALRYQGTDVITGEVQAAWKFHPRWQILGFIGAGRAATEPTKLSDANTETSSGVGFRYLAVKQLGLSMGLDFAKGPEENVVYVSFGTKLK